MNLLISKEDNNWFPVVQHSIVENWVCVDINEVLGLLPSRHAGDSNDYSQNGDNSEFVHGGGLCETQDLRKS